MTGIKSSKKIEETKRAVKILVPLSITLILLSLAVSAAVPSKLNIHGKLTDSNDNELSGNYDITFRIYNSSSGGSIVWESIDQSVTTDTNGVFSTILSGINLSFPKQYYLGISVESDSEMTPRIDLTTAPYAFRANVSESLDTVRNYTVDSMFITGMVGIGTTSPTQALDIQGQIVTTDRISSGEWVKVASDGKLYSNGGGLGLRAGSSGDNHLQITSNGNVGIGTASPSEKLHVVGNMVINGTSLYPVSTTNLGSSSRFFNHLYSTYLDISSTATIDGSNTGIVLIDSIYGLSIGDPSTTGILSVQGNGDQRGIEVICPMEQAEPAIYVSKGMFSSNDIFAADSDGDGTGDSFVIDSSGYVGIGDATPEEALHVNGNIMINDNNKNYRGTSKDVSDYFDGSKWIFNGEVGTPNVVFTGIGNVGIGTNSPQKKLVVNGTLDALTFDPSASTPTMNTTGNNVTITSAAGSVIIRLG
ncbi:hypothetical protein KY366_06695 [Candidatus Woesearchaeota archaeon]|nr:hypothetical protein [Candidatus Woesearchaeota archaeon]